MRQFATFTLLGFVCLFVHSDLQAAGVWTKLAHANPSGGSGTMLLLTDGTVMVQGPGVTKVWSKLTPDSSGNYINGTWSSMASMNLERLYFASNVLPSGKVFVLGGEYSGPLGSQNIVNSGEMYDPVANKWTPIASFPQSVFGDDPSVLLPNGKILCGYIFDATTYLYDPTANTWTQAGTKLRGDASDEETWVLLPGGNVLSYDIFSSPETGQGFSQYYKYSTGTWVDAGKVPVPLTGSFYGYELGPASRLPDGRVFQIGANNNTVLYNPTTNSWTRGPTLPAGMGADDAPGAMLPNGHYLFAADTPLFNGPTKLFDFDYTTNRITDDTPTGTLGGELTGSAYTCRMLVLPNGHLLFTTGGSDIWDYAPTGAPQSSWAPTITSVVKSTTNSSVYTITGTQLTGISEGAGYGDDAEMSTNYPIVRLTDSSGVVQYPRTTNWTPGVATGTALTTCQFTLAGKLNPGTYQVSVIANGIPSANFALSTVNPGNVVAAYNAGTKTLTLTGDATANSLTVSLQAGVLKVEGANGTTVNQTTSFSVNHTGDLVLTGNLGDGDDSVSVIGVSSSTTNLNLGAGADKAAFTLCNIANLTVDGGPGTDVLTVTSSTVGTLTKLNIP